jgi:transposase
MYALPGVLVESIREDGAGVIIEAVAAAATGSCPTCGQESARRHSQYVRRLDDLPSCGRPVQVRLAVRRFRCANVACPRRTFAEQVAGATRPHGRQIMRLEGVLRAVSAAVGGEAGARLAGRIGVAIGGAGRRAAATGCNSGGS